MTTAGEDAGRTRLIETPRASGSAPSSTASRSGSEIEIEAREDFAALDVGYLIVNGDGVDVCQLRAPIGGDAPAAD